MLVHSALALFYLRYSKFINKSWSFGENGLSEIKHKLFEKDNFVGTPHIAASTIEAQIRVGMESATQIIMGLTGKIPDNLLNKDVFNL